MPGSTDVERCLVLIWLVYRFMSSTSPQNRIGMISSDFYASIIRLLEIMHALDPSYMRTV